MSKILQFVSFAVGTQLILLLNQLLLLPLQIRLWGNAGTASWYSAVAIATLMTVADCGLRTAGHPELLQQVQQQDGAASERFCQTWAWVRISLCAFAVLLLSAQIGYGAFHATWQQHPWPLLLTVAYALEAFLIVRIVFLDSLGAYRAAEAGYFMFAALRLILALPALMFLHWGPNRLSALFLATAAAGLLLQGQLCQIPEALRAFAPLPARLNLNVLMQARYTIAEPCANWFRLSLPVLVVAAIATPAAVTLLVALRAVFGAARTSIQQIARVASVEYLRLRGAKQPDNADRVVSLAMLLTTFAGTALGTAIVADNLRLLGIWLPHAPRPLFQEISLAFAASAAFYSYQVIVAILFRTGRLAQIAHRQYAYILYAGAFGLLSRLIHSFQLYLALLVLAEIVLTCSFLGGDTVSRLIGFHTRIGKGTLGAAFSGMGLLCILWLAVHIVAPSAFVKPSVLVLVVTAFSVIVGLSGLLALSVFGNPGLVRLTSGDQSPVQSGLCETTGC